MESSHFKHHSYFPKEKHIQTYLLPHVCFGCHKSFKKPHSEELRKCPDCGAEMVQLSRKFKPPKKTNTEAWSVVEYIVKAGFLYQSLRIENGRQAKYPNTLKDAVIFVVEYKDRLSTDQQD